MKYILHKMFLNFFGLTTAKIDSKFDFIIFQNTNLNELYNIIRFILILEKFFFEFNIL